MVWSHEAKINFTRIRRKKAVESYVQAAELLHTSVKVAKRKARKEFSREYKRFKEQTHEKNKVTRQINKLYKRNLKKTLTRQEMKKLVKLEEKQAKIIHKIDQKWNMYMAKIKFQPVGDEDERSKRDTP